MKTVHNAKTSVKASLIVYFDSNAFRNIAERDRATEHQRTLLRKSISKGRIVFAPSFEVFEELVSVLKLDDERSKRFCKLYDSLVDWDHCLKPMDQILADDITSYANDGRASCPFDPIDEGSPFIQSVRAMQYITTRFVEELD